MLPRLLFVLTVVGSTLIVTATARGDDATKEVEKGIAALNDAFQKRDADGIKRLTVEDHVAITPYYGGPFSRADQLATLADLKISEYVAAKTKITLLTKDTALLTYELTAKGTFKGKELARKSYASAIWVKKDSAWLEAFYQETPLETK
jgi:ketosteroid isomerase-like protein